MQVTMLCPNLKCKRILQVPETTRGHRVRCGFCGQILVVPTKDPSKQRGRAKTPHAAPAE
jgi:ribosomal protein S27E